MLEANKPILNNHQFPLDINKKQVQEALGYLSLAEIHLANKELGKAVPFLEKFRDIILGGKITADDMSLMKEKFNHVIKMYKRLELSDYIVLSSGLLSGIEGLDKIQNLFN